MFVFVFAILLSSFVIAQDVVQQPQTNFKDKSNAFLEKDIQISEDWQGIARIVFGIKSGEVIDFQSFIVLIALLVILFLIIHEVLTITPIFGEGVRPWIGGVVITLLISTTGAIKESVVFFFGFGVFFRDISLLNLLFTLVLLVLLAYGAFMLIKIIRHETRKEQRRMGGFKSTAPKI